MNEMIADELRKIADRLEGKSGGLYMKLDSQGDIRVSNSPPDYKKTLNWLRGVDIGPIKLLEDRWTKVKLVEVK